MEILQRLGGLEILTFLIVLLGSITVILSLWVGGHFYLSMRRLKGSSRQLTAGLTYQLFGEAIIGAGTLAFAIMAWRGYLQNIPVEIQSSLRLFMFFCTSVTTFHLYRVVGRMNKS